ncbi:lipopolysaccharide biosynthesis protein [Aerococcus urinae]|uniref:lipopolysaccharide biosynthesis protein n=1 Tax=Aerococcus urinae TaxID=1376 RepID=UPI00227A5941|nr:lipopolysaccharide biosynthesis protein [Aerococcus urinae]MCY3046602.1 lipopolysaccharide biosynthesis protein [Aerococcus urinae]
MILNRLKEGIIYNAIGKYSNVVIQLLLQVILARLITPAEFGIVAIVNVFLVFFQLLADFGIGPAIIQRKDIDRHETNQIYSFSIYFSLFLAIIFAVLAQPISQFYNKPELVRAVPVMVVALLFNSLCMVPQNLLLKEKRFKQVNFTQVMGSLFNGIFSVTFAFMGFSFYSIIFGNIARALIQLVIYLFSTKLKFVFKFSLDPLKKIFPFAKNQMLFNIINYFSRNLDSILIGRYMPADQLGYYDKSYQLTLYPNTIFTGVITSAIQPIFSDFQNDLTQIKNGYLNISKVLANFSIPLTIFLFFSAEDIIYFLYGDQWGESVLAFQILSISVWIQMLQSTTGAFFQSANRTDLLLLSGILSTALNIIGIIIGVYQGSIYWVATMVVISFSLNFFQTNYLMLNRAFDSSIGEFFAVLIKPLLVGLVTLIAFILLPNLTFNSFINLCIKGIVFLVTMLIGLIITNQLKDLWKMIRS